MLGSICIRQGHLANVFCFAKIRFKIQSYFSYLAFSSRQILPLKDSFTGVLRARLFQRDQD